MHFGSLLAACASYLQARTMGGRWLLRIEDIDPPREQPGAAQQIIATLEAFGFQWDEPVVYQSASAARHRKLIEQLVSGKHAYRCTCTRLELATARRGPLGTVYPGTCRSGCSNRRAAIRVLTDNRAVTFIDGLQGAQIQHLESDSGDFVIRRRDGLIAYHLAVVADDYDQGISEIVRGIDLMDSTPRQIFLQQILRFRTPRYLHIPVIVNDAGQKLSKQTGAPGLLPALAAPTLVAALAALAQRPPPGLEKALLSEIWGWAMQHWDIRRLIGQTTIQLRDYPLAAAQNGLS
jgi:glutamyl-Q tRNA(Asp) synthetase